MTSRRSIIRLRNSLTALLTAFALCVPLLASADLDTITVTAPTSLSFNVHDVSVATVGTPNPFTISFTSVLLVPFHSVKISVRANSSGFTPPSGSSIPASKVSWTITGATNGSGSSGTLSSSAFTQVYLSNSLPPSGSVGLRWSLAAPGAGIRAGNHNLTVTWKFEAL
jgi:hypothetical protein